MVSPGAQNDEAIWKTLDVKTSFIICHCCLRIICRGNEQTLYLKCTKGPIYTFLYKNIVSPAEAEYFNFSADISLIIMIIANDISVLEGIWCLDCVKVIWGHPVDILSLIYNAHNVL